MAKKYLQNKEGFEELKKESKILELMLSNPKTVYTKSELMFYANKSDRAVRDEMEHIANFYPVRATAGRNGYSLIYFDENSSKEELMSANQDAMRQISEIQNRINSLKARLKPLIATCKVTCDRIKECEEKEKQINE